MTTLLRYLLVCVVNSPAFIFDRYVGCSRQKQRNMDAKQPLSRTQFQHARNSCGCTHPLEQNVEVRGNEEDTVALITDFFAIKNFFMGPKKRDNNSKLQVKVHVCGFNNSVRSNNYFNNMNRIRRKP
jgi:hypothetical protein